MNDDQLDLVLRTWLKTHAEAAVPASLSAFLRDLPRTQAEVHAVSAPRRTTWTARRKDLALLLVAATVAVAIGVGLVAGGFLPVVRPSQPPPAASPLGSPAASPHLPEPTASATGPYAWTLVSSTGDPSTYAIGSVIRRDDGTLLAIGFGQESRILTSTDGRSWSVEGPDPGLLASEPNHLSLVSALAEQKGVVAAVGATALDDISSGDARAWTSTDGIHFDAAPATPDMHDAEMEAVTAGPSGFVAVGSDGFPGGNTQLPGARGAAAWVSSDGHSWTRAPAQASFAGAVMFGVRRTGSGYIAWGEIHGEAGGHPGPPIWTSADGLHWKRAGGVADAASPSYPITSIVAVGDRLVAVGARQLPQDQDGNVSPAAWSSDDDGRTWNLASLPGGAGATPAAGGLSDVALSGSELLAVGHLVATPAQGDLPSALIWRSTDGGTTWTALPADPTFAGALMYRVLGTDSGFLAFGAADDPNAQVNPNLIWLAERPAAPEPTSAAGPEEIRSAGFARGGGGLVPEDVVPGSSTPRYDGPRSHSFVRLPPSSGCLGAAPYGLTQPHSPDTWRSG